MVIGFLVLEMAFIQYETLPAMQKPVKLSFCMVSIAMVLGGGLIKVVHYCFRVVLAKDLF